MSEQLLESSQFEEYRVPPIRYRLSEFLVEETGLIHELRDLKTGDKLPTESDWLRSENSTEPILEYISFELGENVDTVSKRVYDMSNEKYLILQKPTEHEFRPITNMRLTGKGIKYYVQATEKIRQEEGILDEKEVADLELMVKQCADRAKRLGNIALAESYKNRYDLKSPFEFSRDEFEAELQTITEKLTELDDNS